MNELNYSDKGSFPIFSKIYIETLVAQWGFDEQVGNIAYDNLAKHNGTIIGCSLGKTGVNNASIRLGGDGDAIIMQHSDSFNISKHFTISAWIKIPDSKDSDGVILNKIGMGAGYSLEVENGNITFKIVDSFNNVEKMVVDKKVNDTGWHKIVVRINLDNKEISITIDNTTNQEFLISNIDGEISNEENLIFGLGLNGNLDEVSIYNRILSNIEIDNNYNLLWEPYIEKHGLTDNGEPLTVDNTEITNE